MDADPDVHRPRCEELGAFAGGRYRIVCRPEDLEERVTLGIDLGAVVTRERLAQGAPVICENVRVAVTEFVEETRRSLYVGEEKRDPTARELAHRPRSARPA